MPYTGTPVANAFENELIRILQAEVTSVNQRVYDTPIIKDVYPYIHFSDIVATMDDAQGYEAWNFSVTILVETKLPKRFQCASIVEDVVRALHRKESQFEFDGDADGLKMITCIVSSFVTMQDLAGGTYTYQGQVNLECTIDGGTYGG